MRARRHELWQGRRARQPGHHQPVQPLVHRQPGGCQCALGLLATSRMCSTVCFCGPAERACRSRSWRSLPSALWEGVHVSHISDYCMSHMLFLGNFAPSWYTQQPQLLHTSGRLQARRSAAYLRCMAAAHTAGAPRGRGTPGPTRERPTSRRTRTARTTTPRPSPQLRRQMTCSFFRACTAPLACMCLHACSSIAKLWAREVRSPLQCGRLFDAGRARAQAAGRRARRRVPRHDRR
jgi:hypothetical protein